MSMVVAKRELMEAAQKLVKHPDPGLAEVQEVGQALAQIFSESTGVDCQLKLVMSRSFPVAE